MSSGAQSALEGLDPFLGRPNSDVAADLESFAALLKKWQPAQNLVSRETLDVLWTRHVRDSLQLLPHIPAHGSTFLDFGSGGGFPALPLAIALKLKSVEFRLIEPNRRKCSFLRAVSRELNLAVKVFDERAESVDSTSFPPIDLVTCRATAPLFRLFEWMMPFVGSQTRLLLHKGREHGEEWREAAAYWSADVLVLPSLTDPEGVVLDIRNLKPKNP